MTSQKRRPSLVVFLSSAFVEMMASLVRAAAARVGRVSAIGIGSIGAGARRKPSGTFRRPHYGTSASSKVERRLQDRCEFGWNSLNGSALGYRAVDGGVEG